MKSRWLLLVLLASGMAVSLFHLGALASQHSPWDDALPSSAQAAWLWGIPLAVVLQIVGHTLRAKNSQWLLDVVRPAGLGPSFRGLALGYLFNAVMPFRLGELVRAHVVGKAMSISRGVVFFVILFERAIDGLILSLFALVAAYVLGARRPELMGEVGFLALAVGLVSLGAAALIYILYTQNRHVLGAVHRCTALFNDRIRDRIRFLLWSITYGLHVILRSARLGRFVALSSVAWVLYLLSALSIIQGVAPDRPILDKLSAASAAYLSVSIPSGPAFLGTFQYYFSTLARESLGIGGTPVLLSFVLWAVMVVPFAVVGGVLLFIRRRQSAAEAVSHLEPLKHKLHRDSDISAELSHFLDEYFSGHQVSRVLSRGEIAGEYRIVKTFKGGSNASTLLVWEGDTLCVKKLTLKQHAEKLKAQFEWLKAHAHLPEIPQVTQESGGDDYYAFNIEFRDSFVPFFEYIHSESVENSGRVLERVVDFMYANVYRLESPVRSAARLDDYLQHKVLGKVQDAAALSPALAGLLEYETLVINGRRCLNVTGCLERLASLPQARAELETFYDTPIHGDLTVDNLIVSRGTNEFLVLDPNNENAISDPVVDMAKLYQSLHSGYEFLCQLAKADIEGPHIRFEESTSSRYALLFAHLKRALGRRLPAEAQRAILFHEAVHYFRMLTYRARINEASLPAFYATAVKLFNDFLEQYERPASIGRRHSPDEEQTHGTTVTAA